MTKRLSYANVVATLALVVAVSTGGAYAAVKIGAKDIKKGAVRSKQIANGTIRTQDISTRARSALRGQRGPVGAKGATGAPGTGLSGFFGDGSDGDVTVSAPTTLTRDTYYDDLTVAPGVTLNPGGFRIFVAGTLRLGSGAAIARDGNDHSAGSVTDPLAPGTLGGSGAGANSGDVATDIPNSLGGDGGASMGGPGGTAVRPADDVGGAQVFHQVSAAVNGRSLDGERVNGGAGGAGGSSGSASGGGVVVVIARGVVVNGAAQIHANGGSVPPPFNGSGGAGGGGVVVVVSTVPKPTGLTLRAAGGTALAAPGEDGEPGFTAWLN